MNLTTKTNTPGDLVIARLLDMLATDVIAPLRALRDDPFAVDIVTPQDEARAQLLKASRFIVDAAKDYDRAWQVRSGVAEGAAREAMAATPTNAGGDRLGYAAAKAEAGNRLVRAAQLQLRTEIVAARSDEATEVGASVAESCRAASDAVEHAVVQWNAPLAMRRKLDLAAVTRLASLKDGLVSRPGKEIGQAVAITVRSNDREEIEFVCEVARSICVERRGMAPAKLAASIGLGGMSPAISRTVEDERDVATNVLLAIDKWREANAPASIALGRRGVFILKDAFAEIVGWSAKLLLPGDQSYLDGDWVRRVIDNPWLPVAGASWLERRLPPTPFRFTEPEPYSGRVPARFR